MFSVKEATGYFNKDLINIKEHYILHRYNELKKLFNAVFTGIINNRNIFVELILTNTLLQHPRRTAYIIHIISISYLTRTHTFFDLVIWTHGSLKHLFPLKTWMRTFFTN